MLIIIDLYEKLTCFMMFLLNMMLTRGLQKVILYKILTKGIKNKDKSLDENQV